MRTTQTSPAQHSRSKRDNRAEYLRRLSRTLSSTDLHTIYAHKHEVAFVWGIKDVQEVRPDLDAEQAWEVLQSVRHYHDYSVGVCWDTLSDSAIRVYGNSRPAHRESNDA